MALHSLISYRDPVIDAWTVPQLIPGASEEVIKNFVEGLERTIRAGKVVKENDGFECYRVGVFDDNSGKVAVPEHPEFLIRLKVIEGE